MQIKTSRPANLRRTESRPPSGRRLQLNSPEFVPPRPAGAGGRPISPAERSDARIGARSSAFDRLRAGCGQQLTRRQRLLAVILSRE